MNQIHVLWANPRSTSTAFEWMMRQRGDLECFHEPYGEVWYQGDEPLWPRFDTDSVRTPGLTYDIVTDRLADTAKRKTVFSKDFPHYVSHMWSDEFLAQFNHSFLIRHPAKVITSIHKHWPEFTLSELSFVEQRTLFDRLCDQLGEVPPLIDSDDLLEDPKRVVRLYCEAIGIPFIKEALSWDAGARDEVSWWDGGSFHENLRNSTGLYPQARRDYPDINKVTDKIKKMYDICMPHYEHLYQYRLK